MEAFLMGLILVGLGLTAKVVKDGLHDIGNVKVRIADCIYVTAETEATTLELEEQTRIREQEVNVLRKTVKEMEEKEKELSAKVKSKKRAETANSRTSFKVNLD